ncbi:RWD domain-containing protein 1 [Fasciolopsis buskii]|uniref:RWD domain-containing protein 1 n=1 Tax=Fasciolopsis buskii TaxID=27845 RepID=A0A8E0RSN7_9TREM|nr:RWD domain-containing protein 1 [Fasciolopsis buski]
MDFAEDRESELVTLDSIYEKNFRITRGEGLQKFEVRLVGHAGDKHKVDVECTLAFEYTDAYPQEPPIFQVVKAKSLTGEEVAAVEEIVSTAAQRSLGYIMIFDILSEVQEKLNSLSEKRIAEQKRALKEKQRQTELEEEAKFKGDRVTVDSFLHWNARFLAEISAAREKNKTSEDSSSKRLTGRDMFLRDNRYDDSDIKFLSETGEVVEIDEELFADIGHIDLSETESLEP